MKNTLLKLLTYCIYCRESVKARLAEEEKLAQETSKKQARIQLDSIAAQLVSMDEFEPIAVFPIADLLALWAF